MKKFLFLHILTIILMLPYPAKAMFAKFTQISAYLPRIWQNTRLYSGYSKPAVPKPLAVLSFSEVHNLAQNKKLAHKQLESALVRNEDKQPVSFFTQPATDVKNVWKNVLSQFSIQDWNSMLLQREEDSILRTFNSHLPDYIKTINFEELAEQKNLKLNKRIQSQHYSSKQLYNAQPLDEPMQKYYQKNLEIAGYPRIPTIYHWNNDAYGVASSAHPYTYITSNFLNLPLKQCLGILAHEDQHVKNFHIYKEMEIRSFLDERNTPSLYSHFTEKEADLKASAHGLPIATSLLNYFKGSEKKEKLVNFLYYLSGSKEKLEVNHSKTHPLDSERVNYIQGLVDKLEQEQKGYAWNPFHKTLGLPEWFKRC